MGSMLRRLGVAAAIAMLVIIAVGAIAGESLSHNIVLRAIVGAGAVGALLWMVFGPTYIKSPPGLGVPSPLAPTKREIAEAYVNAIEMYDGRALALWVSMIIDRPQYLERINENVALEDEVPELELTTHQTFRMAASEKFGSADTKNNDAILVPLVLVEKGTLLDGFTVRDSSGRQVPTLSYNHTRGLLAYTVKTIIDIAPEPASEYAVTDREKTKTKVAANLVTAICTPGPKKKKKAEEQAEIDRLLDSALELPVTDEWKQRIRNFCETLVDNYVIVAEAHLGSSGFLSLTYKQQVSVESSVTRLVNRLRSRFGLRYSAIDIPLNIFALEVEAYHMEMNAGPMQYVFDHHLERMNSRVRLTQADLSKGVNKPYVRLHYNNVGPVMHLYIRRQLDEGDTASDSSKLPERLKSVVEFREIPPGALGAAAAVSLMTAIIISFFALTQVGQEPATSQSSIITGSDIPALVIALPGFASVIIGSWLDLSRLRRASLATYMGLGASVTLSLASALYFLLDANKVVPGRVSLGIAGDVAIKTDVGWLILATMAVTCCLFLIRDVIAASRYYFNHVKERVKRRT